VFTLADVVPWGRSFDEYRRMFALSDVDLRRRMLGCGDGPASFNAEATRRGASVVSCDPIYRWSAAAIRERISATSVTILEQARLNAAQFVWDDIGSVEELGRVRITAMETFLDDFERTAACGRYVAAAVPALPFVDGAFDLAVCSHFLFLYSAQRDEAFHVEAIEELLRVAREVRVFPLVALDGSISPHVGGVAEALSRVGHAVSVERVPYEFQRGANQMMRLRRGDGDVR
jgi:hypothetical protein